MSGIIQYCRYVDSVSLFKSRDMWAIVRWGNCGCWAIMGNLNVPSLLKDLLTRPEICRAELKEGSGVELKEGSEVQLKERSEPWSSPLRFCELEAAEWTFTLVLQWFFLTYWVSFLSQGISFRGASLVWSIPSISFFSAARWLLREPVSHATFTEMFTCFWENHRNIEGSPSIVKDYVSP
jgi:hypothetical protein